MSERVHVIRRLADFPPPTPQPTPCRLWQGYCAKGYGVRGDHTKMHRWVWEQVNGPIPPGMHVLHRCDNPPCYRYDHLFLGTHADNMADAAAKSRRHGAHLVDQALVEQVIAFQAQGLTQAEAQRRTGLSLGTVQRIYSRTGRFQ